MKRAGMIFASALLLAGSAFAQMEAPKAGPEVKKLDAFAGSWTLDGAMKAGEMGPAGTTTENQKCEWMEGNFYLVCHNDYKIPMGTGVGLSVLGWSQGDKVYTYKEFNSWGELDEAKGTLDGDTWVFQSFEQSMNMHGRYTIKMTSPTSYTFTYDVSKDGTKWTTMMDGKATKKM